MRMNERFSRKSKTALYATFLFIHSAVFAQNGAWESIGPFSEAPVSAFAQDPLNGDILYAVSSGRLHQSTNKGEDWVEVSTIGSTIWGLAIDPNHPLIFYATGIDPSGEYIFKSTDGGSTWNKTLLYYTWLYDIGVDPNHFQYIHACGQIWGEGEWVYYRSTDGGLNWTNNYPTVGNSQANTIAVDPADSNYIYVGGQVFTYTKKSMIWKSKNRGVTLYPCDTGLTGNSVNDLVIDSTWTKAMYAATSTGIFTISGGDTIWVPWNRRTVAIQQLALDPKNSSILYGASSDSVYRSTDAGANWSASGLGVEGGECSGIAVDLDSSNVVYVANEAGLLKSSDSGQEWHLHSVLNTALEVTALTCAPSSPGLLFISVKGEGVYKTENGLGKSSVPCAVQWEKLQHPFSTGFSIVDIEIHPSDKNQVYTVTQEGLAAVSRKSTNGGNSWPTINSTNNMFAYDIALGSVYIGGSWDHDGVDSTSWMMSVFMTKDEGVTWSRFPLHTEFYKNRGFVKSIAPHPTNSQICYAGGYYVNESRQDIPALMKTTNGGADWNDIGSSIKRNITSVRLDPFNPNKIYAGTEKDPYSNVGGVYVSTDGGTIWQDPAQHFHVNDIVVDPSKQDRLFAGSNSTVYASTDGGASWDEMNEGLDRGAVRLGLDPAHHVLYAATENGVYRCTFTVGVDENDISAYPAQFTLFQNYPNPFNIKTDIRYTLDKTCDIEFSIFDTRGRLVVVLANGLKQSGTHRIVWDGSNDQGILVPSGMYIARLRAGDHVTMKKMVLQK